MIKLLLSGFLVGFVGLVSSCGTGAEQANSKAPSPVQGGTKQQVISAAAPGNSDTLITNDGEVYKSVKIKEITPAGIKITHSSGISGIPYEKLPKELQNELGGFNSKKAEKHRKKIADQQAKIADVFEARQIQNDKLERDREAEIKRSYEAKLERYRKAKLERERHAQLVAAKNRRFGINKAPTRRSSAASSNSSIPRLTALQRGEMIERQRLQDLARRAMGNPLQNDIDGLNKRLDDMEFERKQREFNDSVRRNAEAAQRQQEED
ncbi:hypothetical protein N8649_02115, partial [bacterium]|nr:hypothetical protein [bacterium]